MTATFLLCVAAHQLAVQLVPSAWWVPDLTLAGLVVVVSQQPSSWFRLGLIAACGSALMLSRWVRLVVLGYLVAAWTIQWCAHVWDVADRRLQLLMAGALGAAMTAGLLWLDDLWSWPLLGLATIHVAMTVLAVMFVRRLMRAGRPSWPVS